MTPNTSPKRSRILHLLVTGGLLSLAAVEVGSVLHGGAEGSVIGGLFGPMIVPFTGNQDGTADRLGSDADQGSLAGISGAPFEDAPTIYTDRVMVTPLSADELGWLADAHDSTVLSAPRGSGAAALSVPVGMKAMDFVAALRADDRVARAGAMGMIRGAGNYDSQSMRASPNQWHLLAGRAPLPGDLEFDDFTVAVLDTGVAYAAGSASNPTYVQAPSLAGVAIVAPYDFVNDDSDAWDAHQHGTHIASLIVSEGDVEGVAPGANLMPLKVLDSNNEGSELDLADAIIHATDNGADVINLSLSFVPGYVPGVEVHDAIDYAANAGVILVAAAGNDGGDIVTWPAASPAVIAVAAGRPGKWDDQQSGGSWDSKSLFLADYSNSGAQIDVTVAGGAADLDRSGDGVLDGIAAETINLNDPSTVGAWLYSGTSQAAAQVSGGALAILAAGGSPDQVSAALQYEAITDGYNSSSWESGAGAGSMNLEKVIEAVQQSKSEVASRGAISAGLLPYLRAKQTGKKKNTRCAPFHDAATRPSNWRGGRSCLMLR